MKPICVQCQRFYRPKKNGMYFIEGMPIHNGALAGKAEPENWKPYKLWCGDKWECPDCRAEIIVGCGIQPIAEHYQPDFTGVVAKFGAGQFIVNDC